MRIAQILHGKAHWIFEGEEIPNWPPDPEGNPIILIDITDKPEVQEGWCYNEETGEFTEPVKTEYKEHIETSLEEQIYAENLYQTALLEMQMLGGM